MKYTVIHHSADFDGIFCREIANHFLHDAEFIGWDFGDPPVPVPTEGTVYVMDLPVDRVFDIRFDRHHPFLERTVWIDHHKSSIESHPESIPGYRIDGVAACRLAWQWFTHPGSSPMLSPGGSVPLPSKEEFVHRKVWEPWSVLLAGEYDIWDKRDPDADLLQHGLKSQELTTEDWSALLHSNASHAHGVVVRLLNQGHHVQHAMTRQNESVIRKNGFTVQWEGLTFLACNHGLYNSHLFAAGIRPEHDALLGFAMRSNGKWSVSLYGVPGKPDIDLSRIAVKHGGGGHKQACGFTCSRIEFLP